ncbi:MAG TPA: hypothetical protein VG847_06905 [Chitinophagaceae bacterium]|nr:hypothetical protein [Chitinophagaceae bacterium]
MKFWNAICGFVLLLTFSSLLCRAQNSIAIKFQQKSASSKNAVRFTPVCFNSFTLDRTVEKNFFTLPPDFATRYYGFFCRQELKIEKSTHLPIRLRIGSLQQSNYYEGKEKGVVTDPLAH